MPTTLVVGGSHGLWATAVHGVAPGFTELLLLFGT